jgi:hypothetical protein
MLKDKVYNNNAPTEDNLKESLQNVFYSSSPLACAFKCDKKLALPAVH